MIALILVVALSGKTNVELARCIQGSHRLICVDNFRRLTL